MTQATDGGTYRPRLEFALLTCLAALAGCAMQSVSTPYVAVATVDELMESVIAHAAEIYWDSVSITVDVEGEHEDFPTSDEEWETVWAAGMSIAESGNLLMMPQRRLDETAWVQYATDLVNAGRVAAAAALAKDPEQVLAAGEVVYNVCLACHTRYIASE